MSWRRFRTDSDSSSAGRFRCRALYVQSIRVPQQDSMIERVPRPSGPDTHPTCSDMDIAFFDGRDCYLDQVQRAKIATDVKDRRNEERAIHISGQ